MWLRLRAWLTLRHGYGVPPRQGDQRQHGLSSGQTAISEYDLLRAFGCDV